jgi:hypothetical protein
MRASQASGETGIVTRPPIRSIGDKDPIYSAVAVDPRYDAVVLMDNNNWGLRVFNRLDNTPPVLHSPNRNASSRGPRRTFSSTMFSISSEEQWHLFRRDRHGRQGRRLPRDAKGNVKPARILAAGSR